MKKKILILTESDDITADKVCQWLNCFNSSFFRINTDKEPIWAERVEVKQNEVTIILGHPTGCYNITDFGIIWFRRGSLVNSIQKIKNTVIPDDELVNDQINNHIQRELNVLNEFIYKHIPRSVKQINNPSKYNINKLECLVRAAEIGLKIPDTYIINSKKELEEIRRKNVLITKNIGDILICHSSHFFSSHGTMPVRDKDIDRADRYFFPSLFQMALNKRADVRVFFMLDHFYAYALYDYTDPSSVDFRRSITQTTVPFDLNPTCLKQLSVLASEMGLESGSVDLILTDQDELFFLEINPVGQIDFVSLLTNSYLEKEIAKILMANGKQ